MLRNTLIRIKFISNTFHNMPKKSKNKVSKGSTSSTKDAPTIKPVQGPIKTDADNNILIEVHAKPGAKQNAITNVDDQGVNIQINAPPVEGSANVELVKYMASLLGLKSSNVSLERGHKSRNKVLKISANITLDEVTKKINENLPAETK
ncbi:UPF0235 protein C15orf40 homolog [Dendroctonus ponderosae]